MLLYNITKTDLHVALQLVRLSAHSRHSPALSIYLLHIKIDYVCKRLHDYVCKRLQLHDYVYKHDVHACTAVDLNY